LSKGLALFETWDSTVAGVRTATLCPMFANSRNAAAISVRAADAKTLAKTCVTSYDKRG
jgi:hypothetical protein